MRITGTARILLVGMLLALPATAGAQSGRKTFTISGLEAWSTARQYVFTFFPLRYGCTRPTQPFDGVHTRLIADAPLQCIYIGPGDIASVTGGNMIVHRTNQTVKFEMFGYKKLAPGWKVLDVQISNGRWMQQPSYGTDNMRFVVELTSYSSSVSAYVKKVVLEGPSSATSWQDAFKYAVRP